MHLTLAIDNQKLNQKVRLWMRIKKQGLLFALTILLSLCGSAQTNYENSGWLAWFNALKISGPFSLHLDAQVRSADDLEFVRNVLLRPGITYNFENGRSVTGGYAYIATQTSDVSGSKSISDEHRIWEQLIANIKIAKVTVQNRLRLEQRFIKRQSGDVFAQRIRYFMRSVIPFAGNEGPFTRGTFVAVQNEVFLNIQNSEKINNSLFDQNRAYAAIGYRLSARVDLEAGFLHQYIKGMNANTSNGVFQLALYTRL